jgi:hypothetical protein
MFLKAIIDRVIIIDLFNYNLNLSELKVSDILKHVHRIVNKYLNLHNRLFVAIYKYLMKEESRQPDSKKTPGMRRTQLSCSPERGRAACDHESPGKQRARGC